MSDSGSSAFLNHIMAILQADQILALVMVLVCIMCAGLAAGLTIGLVSIDRNELSLTLINGTPEEKKQAKAILPLLKDHHWLLVTLFLFNATANEALPLFLGDVVPRVASVIIATFTVLIFGEIIPSSIFSGPNQMKLAASLSWVVYLLLFLFYPVAKPIGMFLDRWLGKHDTDSHQAPFNAKDLYTLLSMARDSSGGAPPREGDSLSRNQQLAKYGAVSRASSRTNSARNSFREDSDVENPQDEAPCHEPDLDDLTEHQAPLLLRSADEDDENLLEPDVVTIAQGAIVCSRIYVAEITQASFKSVDADRIVCLEFLEEIGRYGHSRILVTRNKNLLGYLLVKELLRNVSRYLQKGATKNGKAEKALHVRDLHIYPVEYCSKTITVLDALNIMQTGKSRIGVVSSDGTSFGDIHGYFTLEDVMENIIQEEINDETDAVLKRMLFQRGINISSTPSYEAHTT